MSTTQLGSKVSIGDKFISPNGDAYEVIGTKPGGKVEMFVRANTRFVDKYTRDLKNWKKL